MDGEGEIPAVAGVVQVFPTRRNVEKVDGRKEEGV